ncbi:gliding motility lipoprotein GldB [Flavobacterium sp. GA093]|uniref:Gliding motility lipoprotein GldB n=1 Tax=Flavobacterium hydrocarbonoxydans TaxID=2683249 RepID=A0A6I4NLJ2_9FLAO|nr:gliding motility lipoprotein GldB [Flavobacterium hydrocarbonoxydans]MWB95256.1 gliding motility lipoprotein GldB [Flavobacterium hydrocarbonoxydans]
MKLYRLVIVLSLFFLSCDKKTKVEKAVEEIPVDIKVERFDKVFFETKPEDLAKVKKQYPFFFPAGNDDSVWLNKMQDPIWREVYTEVQKKYDNFEPVRQEFDVLFKHIKYYFPKTKTPKVITVIAEMDYNAKAIYADSLVIVALELYLGKEHKFYQFPNYLKQNFEERQIMPDVVSSFSYRNIVPPTDGSLLSQMIFEGKQLYAKDLLLPEYTDAERMGYTPEQIKWCEENESYMWRYFLENELLYSSDPKLATRFLAPSPFSKFYLQIDNDTPGRVGAWIGWQIVRSYMKNNSVTLEELFKINAKEIFEKSKYKPKK